MPKAVFLTDSAAESPRVSGNTQHLWKQPSVAAHALGPATPETEGRGLLEPRSLGLACTTQ